MRTQLAALLITAACNSGEVAVPGGTGHGGSSGGGSSGGSSGEGSGGNEGGADNTPPSAPDVIILPEGASHVDDLRCDVTQAAPDADGDAVSYAMSWAVDGAAWTGPTTTEAWTGDTIAAGNTAFGETWTCTVVPTDGTDDGAPGSASTALGCGDADGDGAADEGCGGEDCDDTDDTVHPGAIDDCDGRDLDCDGVDGVLGALDLGGGDWFSVDEDEALTLSGNGEWTIEAWLWLDGSALTGSDQFPLFDKKLEYGANSTYTDYSVFLQEGQLYWGTGSSSDTCAWLIVPMVELDRWVHLGMVMDVVEESKGDKQLYVDGELVADCTFSVRSGDTPGRGSPLRLRLQRSARAPARRARLRALLQCRPLQQRGLHA